MPSLLICVVLAAQLDKPPEFSPAPAFKKSEVDAAIDSAAHTSGQKTESAKWMVRSLTGWKRSLADAENAAWQNAMAALGRGSLAEASDLFASGAKLFPQHVRQAVGQGATLYARGQYQPAAEVFLASAKRFPAELRLIPYLVELLDAHAGITAQLATWANAHPKSAEAQWAYGMALSASAPALAEKRLEAAARLSLGRDARPLLALAKLRTGGAAIAALEAALQADAGNAEAHYRLSQEYRKLGQVKKADEHLAQYRALTARQQ